MGDEALFVPKNGRCETPTLHTPACHSLRLIAPCRSRRLGRPAGVQPAGHGRQSRPSCRRSPGGALPDAHSGSQASASSTPPTHARPDAPAHAPHLRLQCEASNLDKKRLLHLFQATQLLLELKGEVPNAPTPPCPAPPSSSPPPSRPRPLSTSPLRPFVLLRFSLPPPPLAALHPSGVS